MDLKPVASNWQRIPSQADRAIKFGPACAAWNMAGMWYFIELNREESGCLASSINACCPNGGPSTMQSPVQTPRDAPI
jgi:hypothetical protein